MLFSIVIAALTLISTALAAPAKCLTQQAAEQLVSRFSGILTHKGSDLGDPWYTGTVILAPEYEEISYSALSIMHDTEQPTNGTVPTLRGRDTILADLLAHPGVGYAETLVVYPVDCNKVLWYWTFWGVNGIPQQIKGFNLLTVNQRNLISQNHFEVSSIAWDIGTYGLQTQ